jgi:hypothetical protein
MRTKKRGHELSGRDGETRRTGEAGSSRINGDQGQTRKGTCQIFGAKNARGIDSWVGFGSAGSGSCGLVVVVVMAHRETNSGEREPGSDS